MIDPRWEQTFSSRGWGEYPPEELVRFIAREQPRKVLEIGCGPGANLWLLARKGIQFDAIDGSATAIHQARARLDRETSGWKGRLAIGDYCQLPEDFTGYDAVIDSEALCCATLEQAREVIGQIRKRLNPNGAMWSRTFAPGTPERFRMSGRTTTREELKDLYRGWHLTIGEITRHDGDESKTVREWIVTASK